jgi:hypothetical protein
VGGGGLPCWLLGAALDGRQVPGRMGVRVLRALRMFSVLRPGSQNRAGAVSPGGAGVPVWLLSAHMPPQSVNESTQPSSRASLGHHVRGPAGLLGGECHSPLPTNSNSLFALRTQLDGG